MWHLKEQFSEQIPGGEAIPVWGVVVFVHPHAVLEIEAPEIPVCKVEKLRKHVAALQTKLSPPTIRGGEAGDRGMMPDPLAELKTGWWSFSIPGYREHPTHTTYSLFPYGDLPPIEAPVDVNWRWLHAQPAHEQWSLAENGQNSGATPHNVTITSIADEYGRLGSITSEAVAAGVIKSFGPFKEPGWQQADGMLYFEADHAEIKFAVLRQP